MFSSCRLPKLKAAPYTLIVKSYLNLPSSSQAIILDKKTPALKSASFVMIKA